jgi:Winged helix DNA-binding domain
MTHRQIANRRLYQQGLAGTSFKTPVEVVRWLGAVQAQDYLGSLWAIGLRMRNATEEAIEQAIADRSIIRTWPMRGTLHFVAATDVRWMLALLAPRVIAKSQSRFKQLDLNARVFSRSRKLFEAALSGGQQLPRGAMYRILEAAGIATANSRGAHILGRLAQDGIICFGQRQGKQQTFVLLSEWALTAKSLRRDEGLAEIAMRYFTSHGPATLQDFVWWSGLTMADARAGLEMASSHLTREAIGGRGFWFSPTLPSARVRQPNASLLPAYDEFTVAYKDRSAVLDPAQAKRMDSGKGMLAPTIVVNGRIVGTWKCTIQKRSVVIAPNFFAAPGKAERQASMEAGRRYGSFLGLPAMLV